MTNKNPQNPPTFTAILIEIERVRAKIDSLKTQFGVDLSQEYSELLKLLSSSAVRHLKYNREASQEFRARMYARLVKSTLDNIHNVEFEACSKVLSNLTEKYSKYAQELEESLIDTGELRRAIYEAQRQKSKAGLKGRETTTVKDSIEILDKEIEKLSIAYSDMQAKAPGERRKVSFKLVEIFIAYLLGTLGAYITYKILYLHSDPFEINSIGLFAAFYLISCIGIYVAIGWIARVRYKGQAKTTD